MSQVFSTKYSLTLPAAALSYIEQVLVEVGLRRCRTDRGRRAGARR
jgi:hypothetical protein